MGLDQGEQVNETIEELRKRLEIHYDGERGFRRSFAEEAWKAWPRISTTLAEVPRLEKHRDDLQAALKSEQVDARMLRAYLEVVSPDTEDFGRWLRHAHAAKEWREHRTLQQPEGEEKG